MIHRIAVVIVMMSMVISPRLEAFGRDEAGTSAAPMLSQPGSARLLAMGGAGTALASGAEALWWNPAGLGRGDKLSAEITLRKQWDETEIGYLGGIIVTPWGTPGLAVTYAQTRGISGYDEAGQGTGNFSTYDLESKLAYAFLVNPVYVGVAVNYLYQNFFTSQVRGFGSDLGAVWEFWNKCFVGISLLHLGRTWVGDWMPFEGRLGLGTTLIQGVEVATDLIVARDSHAYFAAGAEWFPWDMFGFRLGIHNGPLDVAGLGDYALMTAGVGYRWEQLKIDYYFETNSEIGDAHHLTLGYRTYVAPPKPEPIYQPVTGPREEVPEIRYAAQYVFTPSPLPKDCEARELVFKVQDKDGHVLKTMAFSNGNIPKDITWDGTDEQGNFVAMQALKFSFIFQTNQGVKTQVQEWPYTEPARKLYFPEGGFGIEPEVHFSVFGKPNAVRQWQVQIVSERKGEQVYTAGGQGSVPEHLLWDGKTSNGTWADPGQKYTMRMMLNGPQGSVVIDRPVLPIYSVMLKSGSPQRVRFKIHKILFDFNQKTLPPQMSEPVLQAVAIQRKYNEKARVKINGYGDQLGSQWANYHVSRQRALDVLTFMRRNGASLSWPVQIEGMGKERLITKKMSEAERAKNRRVDIVFDVPVLETESKQKK